MATTLAASAPSPSSSTPTGRQPGPSPLDLATSCDPSLKSQLTQRPWHGLRLTMPLSSAHWAAFLIIDQFLHHHHHKSRLQVSPSSILLSPTPTQGYLDFYIRTKNIRRAPFYILSVGNATLMIVVMILHDLCDSGGSGCSHTFSKVRPACGSPLTACRWTTCGVSSPWSPWW